MNVKRNNVVFILVQIIIIMIAIIGVTFAISYIMNSVNIGITSAELAVDYSGEVSLNSGNSLFPILDSEIYTNTDKVLKVEFNVKGVSTNPSNTIYDVVLENLVIDEELRTDKVKWVLIKNRDENGAEEIYQGDLSYEFDVIKNGRLVLTEKQQYLHTNTNDNYEFIMWLSTTCSNLLECNEEDEMSQLLGKNINGKIAINLYKGEPVELVRETSSSEDIPLYKDPSGANSPVLLDGMIPVVYNGSAWEIADTTKQWYSYTERKWANAVLVSDGNYRNAKPGTAIPEDQVLAYYVWIPRYKYQLFNYAKNIGTDSYDAENTGININFESGTSTTGTVICNISSLGIETCKNKLTSGQIKNGDWYTHPAFWWDENNNGSRDANEELTGIWVGKFETSSSTPNAARGGGSTTSLDVRIKPNVPSWRGNNTYRMYSVIKKMVNTKNEYGLSNKTTDSHLIKNSEWGAVAYFTHSIYGRCPNKKCTEITINSSEFFKTGGGDYLYNISQSSTANVTGIYDLNGGTYEYVMGNMLDTDDTFHPGDSGFWDSGEPERKYYDVYSYGENHKDYKRAHLGDAMGEVIEVANYSWNDDWAYFYDVETDSSNPWARSWVIRGGYWNNSKSAGLFQFVRNSGNDPSISTGRAILIDVSKSN